MKKVQKLFWKGHAQEDLASVKATAAAASELALKEEHIEQLRRIIYKSDHEIAALNSQVNNQAESLSSLQEINACLKQQLVAFSSQASSLSRELDLATADASELKEQVARLTESKALMAQELQKKDAMLERCRSHMTTVNLQLYSNADGEASEFAGDESHLSFEKENELLLNRDSNEFVDQELSELVMKMNEVLTSSLCAQGRQRDLFRKVLKLTDEKDSLLQDQESLAMLQESMEGEILSLKQTLTNYAQVIQEQSSKITNLKASLKAKSYESLYLQQKLAHLKPLMPEHSEETNFSVAQDFLKTERIRKLEQKLKESSQFIKDTARKDALLCKENEELRARVHTLQRRNYNLVNQLKNSQPRSKETDLQTLKRKLQGISEPLSPHTQGGLSSYADSLHSIKVVVERIYKTLMMEIHRHTEEDGADCFAKSPGFCRIENELNSLIMNIHERIEVALELSADKRLSRQSTHTTPRVSELGSPLSDGVV